ncbi:GNAT family N-acetyltransferase [Roseomonas sp. SSH11]|uniref:GNAT family N-acetyltransferase n=1 Tax=Pararoseomonas baculiformis TaxID=2820812 RepID=A0ABS4AGQ8_9PROT|nr:GNAT family N-acetyltransferase [Pararoseomonas baculiformis]MBP0446066.1 GNAT family N-acetyltransferase [Pararoseomonas baculiformis]
MVQVRRARPEDAPLIGAIHRIAWQDAYPGVLPDAYLASLNERRLAAGYLRAILARRGGEAVFVAGTPDGRIIGFASAALARREGIAAGEIETLYLLPDWRDQGIGRRLMRASAAHLAAIGCGSAMLWVLSANGAGWFYRRLGGRPVGREMICVGGHQVEQTAVLWDPITLLLDATAATREGDALGEG